ncbi:MAG: transglutaminase family protein [Bryobacterales bacterium]|nr:transglutaminase family protein [Bryobacterales bacterium]
MRPLAELLAGRTVLTLDRAALLVATLEHPGLDPEPWVQLLDSHAAELGGRIQAADGEAFIQAANDYLFTELGFRGNAGNYYDPSNSCLNEVLVRRTGIPITLAVIYLEIGRRLGFPLAGAGLPGHFLVRYDGGPEPVFLDPFHGGRQLDAEGCFALAASVTGIEVPRDPALLAPVSTIHIAARMLNNLRGVYIARAAYRKALPILDTLIEAFPAATDEYRHRGTLLMRLQRMAEARRDFERYLDLATSGEDERATVEKQLAEVNRWLARLN